MARVLVIWVITAATLMLLSALLAGFTVDSFGAALAGAALIGLINALVWPLVIRIALPITVLTLGPCSCSTARSSGVSAIDTGMHVRGLGVGIVVPSGSRSVNTW